VTLVELLVVIAILGVMAGVVGVSWATRPWGASGEEEPGEFATVSAARRLALTTGTAVTVSIVAGGRSRTVTALPDGRLIGVRGLGVDPLTGRPQAVVDLR
jgi:prepilin-type N-terminal cleavage/methylation domain-containing protein